MDLKTAESLARQRVATLCPEIADVTPRVSRRERYTLSPASLGRLGLSEPGRGRSSDGEEYTFTFAAELRAGELVTPKVAHITVNMRTGVVRATLSK